MFKNSSKIIFFIILFMSSLISISSNSWFGAWMGLEINLLSFIPLMIVTNNLMSTEAALKYFLTQTLASSMLLFSVIIYMFFYNLSSSMLMILDNNISMIMICSTLLLKSGAAPFHFWFPGVMEGLNWMNNLILITWQKIAPMMLISYCLMTKFLMIIVIISTLIGSLGGLNQTSLRKIMAFSSINHLGWMISAMILKENLWEIYFFMYSFLCFSLIFLFNSFKLFHINQSFSMFSNNLMMKICLFLSLLSLGGLPPFLGFLPKWLIIQYMTINNMYFMIFIVICLTLITLYYYLRICYSAFMMNYWETNWFFFNKINLFNFNLTLFFCFFSIFGLIFINLVYFI